MISISLLLLQELPIDDMFIKSFNHAYMHLGGQGERVLGWVTLFLFLPSLPPLLHPPSLYQILRFCHYQLSSQVFPPDYQFSSEEVSTLYNACTLFTALVCCVSVWERGQLYTVLQYVFNRSIKDETRSNFYKHQSQLYACRPGFTQKWLKTNIQVAKGWRLSFRKS